MPARWQPAYIGIGSNIGSPIEQVKGGIAAIGRYPETRVVTSSPLYRSAPMGQKEQPDFTNAVVAILTRLEPARLLAMMQETERQHGRDRSVGHWGPRTLDLDLLSYSAVIETTEALTLPHPGIADRNFVLLPWSDISPYYVVPGLASVQRLAANLPPGTELQEQG